MTFFKGHRSRQLQFVLRRRWVFGGEFGGNFGRETDRGFVAHGKISEPGSYDFLVKYI